MIKLNEIHKYFGNNHILKGVNLNVKTGEKLVVIGPSGSGKSTLIRCMNLLEKPDKGSVIINNVDITLPKAPINKVRESVAMVFQHFNLYPHKTVLENVTLAPIIVKKVSKAEAEKSGLYYLEKVGLKDKANSYPSQLSGGQQQRVAIARALQQVLVLAQKLYEGLLR